MAQSTESHRVKATLVSQDHTNVSNRDVYLLRVIPRSGGAFDATAVDTYPAYLEALPLHGLSKNVTLSVRLIRAPTAIYRRATMGKERPSAVSQSSGTDSGRQRTQRLTCGGNNERCRIMAEEPAEIWLVAAPQAQ
jgi:hypothetical protein